MSSVSSGSESGRMKYLISLPLMLIWSRLICAPPLGVIFAVRKLVFICGDTEAIVPWTIVPEAMLALAQNLKARHVRMCNSPVFSSIVTVSFVHFIKNLPCPSARLFRVQPCKGRSACDAPAWWYRLAYLTSFMFAVSRRRARLCFQSNCCMSSVSIGI